MNNPAKVEGQKAYTVLKIDELSRLADMGGIEHYYRHSIKTRGGIVLTVNIDERDFTAEKVAPILKQRASEADKILEL